MLTEGNVTAFWYRLDQTLKNSARKNLKALCASIGIPYQTLINQKSQGRYPTVPMIMTLASEFSCSVDWLLFGEDRGLTQSLDEHAGLVRRKEIINVVLMSDSNELLSSLEHLLMVKSSNKKNPSQREKGEERT